MIHVEDHTLCFPFWQEISPFWQEDVCKEQTTLAAKDSWFIENPFHSCFTVWWDSCLIAYGVVWLQTLVGATAKPNAQTKQNLQNHCNIASFPLHPCRTTRPFPGRKRLSHLNILTFAVALSLTRLRRNTSQHCDQPVQTASKLCTYVNQIKKINVA